MDIDQIIKLHGNWTAHNIEYGPGSFTMPNTQADAEYLRRRARTYGAIAENALGRSLNGLRVLDIGCFEGGITYHLAHGGADVVGLEARDSNLAKCNFIAHKSSLDNLKFTRGDMLKLDELKLGKFDVILAAGVVYHVDAPDLLPFLRSLRSHCRGVTLIDTHVSLQQLEFFELSDGRRIYGRSIVEHQPCDSVEAKDQRTRSSLRNNYSFWPTERSLANILVAAGFGGVVKPLLPTFEWRWIDRAVWVADARSPIGVFHANLEYCKDPDPRPMAHSMLEKPHNVWIKNPHTKKL